MRVSVVIPVYNVERYLARCLDSVLAAAAAAPCETEVICVNDGSTDGSAAVLAKYADRVKVIAKENGGLGSARNAGLDAMAGDYVTFVDSDDWIPECALAKFAEVAKASGAALVVSTSFEKDERLTVNGEQLRNGSPSERLTVNGEQLRNGSPSERLTVNGGQLRNCNPSIEDKSAIVNRSPSNVKFHIRSAEWIAGRKVQYCAWNKLYRVDLFRTRRYPATIYEDLPVTTDIFREVGEFAAIGEPLYVYCTNAGASSLVRSAFTERKMRDSMTVVRMTLDLAKGKVREKFARRQAADGLSSTVGQVCKAHDAEIAAAFVKELDGLLSAYPEMARALTLKAKVRLWRIRKEVGA